MNNHKIVSFSGGDTLFSGRFPDFRSCVEHAISDGVSLRNADLSHSNLLNAQLDGGDFREAVFINCNLSGVNASECRMDGARFNAATLYGAVFCESSLNNAIFKDASFGATDIYRASLENCVFSTLSAFTLNFSDASTLYGSYFINPCGTICAMSHAPLVIDGLQQKIIFMDNDIKIGHAVFKSLKDSDTTLFSKFFSPANIRLRLEQLAAFRCIQDHDDLTFHKEKH